MRLAVQPISSPNLITFMHAGTDFRADSVPFRGLRGKPTAGRAAAASGPPGGTGRSSMDRNWQLLMAASSFCPAAVAREMTPPGMCARSRSRGRIRSGSRWTDGGICPLVSRCELTALVMSACSSLQLRCRSDAKLAAVAAAV